MIERRTKLRCAGLAIFILLFSASLTLCHLYFLDNSSSFHSHSDSRWGAPPTEAPSKATATATATTATAAADTTAPTATPTPHPLAEKQGKVEVKVEPYLLSQGRSVKADVKGNLGPPEVVTNVDMKDWLKDRWQAAGDMSGTPLRGKHWLEIDLERPCIITSTLIDFEVAYSRDWSIQGKVDSSSDAWVDLITSKSPSLQQRKVKLENYEHVIQFVNITFQGHGHAGISQEGAVRFVRLLIHSPSTRWGTSIWRWQIYGVEV